MPACPPAPLDALEDLLACAQIGMDAAEELPAGVEGFLWAGAEPPPLVNCCPAALWVRAVNIYASEAFPLPSADPLKCATATAALVAEVGFARCVTTPPKSGRGVATIPTPTMGTIDTRQQLLDGWTIRNAIACCLTTWRRTAPDYRDAVLGDQAYFNDGSCYGSLTQVTIALPVPCCG